jgi:hypothetical protein
MAKQRKEAPKKGLELAGKLLKPLTIKKIASRPPRPPRPREGEAQETQSMGEGRPARNSPAAR